MSKKKQILYILFPAALVATVLYFLGIKYISYAIVITSLTVFCIDRVVERLFYQQYWTAVFLMVVSIVGAVLAFSQLYSIFGLADGSGNRFMDLSELDAIYFSIVTWTTLGYGDMQPIGVSKIVAMIEVILGYVSMGLLVGLSMLAIQKTATKNQKTFERLTGHHVTEI